MHKCISVNVKTQINTVLVESNFFVKIVRSVHQMLLFQFSNIFYQTLIEQTQYIKLFKIQYHYWTNTVVCEILIFSK